MRALTGSLSVLAVLLASATASAQPIPGFGTMDRFDEQSKFATSLSYISFDDGFFEDLTVLRFDFFGQYMTPDGLGGYAMMPFNRISFMDNSESGVGNLEIGGLYVVQGATPIVLRGGIALDTADSQTGGIGLFSRITDFPSDFPDTTWLRLSASPLWRTGTTFFRVDAGLDVPIDDGDSDIDPLVRLNVGGGIETGDIAIMGELVTVGTTDTGEDGEDGPDLGERFIHTLAATGRYMGGGNLQPHFTLSIPLDDDTNDVIDFVVIIGLEYVFPTSTAPLGPAGNTGPPPGAY